MPLPKIATPSYELEIPSSGKKIRYRPFLVKEEKILIMALESEDPKEISHAVKTVIANCVQTKGVKVDDLATFDIEYLFLNIRGKSVGEEVDVLITCPDDNETQVPQTINLDEIKVQKNPKHSRDIKLDDSLVLRMRYPSMNEFVKSNFNVQTGIDISETFDLISSCIDQVYNDQESWSASECTKKELNEFIEQLSSKQFKQIESFFETMPKLSHTIKIKNPKTNVESEVVLEGLSAFFA
jgi:hypothetical protein